MILYNQRGNFIEMSNVEFYDTLCNNHNMIIHKLQQMKKLTKDERIRKEINELLEYSRHCKKQGQRMENRLRKWNDLITRQMGYQRVRKEKKSWD